MRFHCRAEFFGKIGLLRETLAIRALWSSSGEVVVWSSNVALESGEKKCFHEMLMELE